MYKIHRYLSTPELLLIANTKIPYIYELIDIELSFINSDKESIYQNLSDISKEDLEVLIQYLIIIKGNKNDNKA
jgi:hypothetical protein